MKAAAAQSDNDGIEDPTEAKRSKAKFWDDEIAASQKRNREWQKRGTKIVSRYLDERGSRHDSPEGVTAIFKLNLFHKNVKTMSDMMYNHTPAVDVSRTQDDANDDVARVAGNMMERILNLDMANKSEDYDSVLRGVLQDRLLPGLGCARVRYECNICEIEVAAVVDTEGEEIVAAATQEVLVSESAPIDYYHWQDVLWGWCRSWTTMPWLGFATHMTKHEVTERFSKEIADELEYSKQKVANTKDDTSNPNNNDTKSTAAVWEIWDKESKKVRWWSKGVTAMMDTKDDTLGLTGFYPAPPFFIANPTTSLLMPTADFTLAQDLYNEIDKLQTRIAIITEAVKVVGVYDASAEGVQRMMKEGTENELIPVDNWAMWAEKGGLQGQIDWMPIAQIADVLGKLEALRDQTIALLQNITGMSDIMNGALNNQYEGVGQSQLKAQFGSVAMQALQGQFATFATNLLQIKAEIICKHFDAQTIVTESNMKFSQDVDLVPAAVQLLKEPEMAYIRIEIRSEAMGMLDYASLKSERVEFLTAFSTFLQSAAPMIEKEPDSMPFMLQMLQWTMAGFKGSQEIEGVLDKLVDGAMQKAKQPQEPPPNPQLQVEQQKQQGAQQMEQQKAQNTMQARQADMQADIQTIMAGNQAKIAEINAASQAQLQEISAKFQADVQLEQLQNQGNIAETNASADAEMRKDTVSAQLDLTKTASQLEMDMDKAAGEAKIELTALGNKQLMESEGKQEDAQLSVLTHAADAKIDEEKGGDDDAVSE